MINQFPGNFNNGQTNRIDFNLADITLFGIANKDDKQLKPTANLADLGKR